MRMDLSWGERSSLRLNDPIEVRIVWTLGTTPS
jgi:hypothetical protein